MANSYYATVHARFFNKHVRDRWVMDQRNELHVDCVSDRYEKGYMQERDDARQLAKDNHEILVMLLDFLPLDKKMIVMDQLEINSKKLHPTNPTEIQKCSNA